MKILGRKVVRRIGQMAEYWQTEGAGVREAMKRQATASNILDKLHDV